MPTIDRLSPTAALAWLRAQVDRLRRSVMAQRPAVRWGLALVALLGLAAGGLLGGDVVEHPRRPLSRLGSAAFTPTT